MAKKQRSEANKRYYSSYNGTKQREKRLKRHMKNHPNDVQSSKASPVYRRRKPLNKGGWLTRQMANFVYIGKLPGKDDQAVNVLNAMKPVDRMNMARLASTVRSIHNRLEYEKEDKSTAKIGYAG